MNNDHEFGFSGILYHIYKSGPHTRGMTTSTFCIATYVLRLRQIYRPALASCVMAIIMTMCVLQPSPLRAEDAYTVDPSQYNNLAGPWLRSTDNGHSWSEVQVPFLERDFVGTMIIKRDIVLPANNTGDMLLLAGRIDDGDNVTVNGQRIGGMPGSWDERRGYAVHYFRDRVYRVPAQILRPGKTNTIEITIYNYSGFGGITGSNIALLNDTTFFDNILPELLELPRRHELLYYVLIGLFVAFALISVLNFAYFREDKSDLYLFIVLINFIIFTWAGVLDSSKTLIDNYSFIAKINPVSLLLSLVAAAFFLKHFFAVHMNRVTWLLLGLLSGYNLMLCLLIIVLPLPRTEQLFTFFIRTIPAELLILLLMTFRGRKSLVEHQAVRAGMILWTATGIYDMFYYFRWIDLAGGALSVYGYFIFLTTITLFKAHANLVLRLRLKETNIELRELNQTLEQKVHERTEELAGTLERLQQAHNIAEKDMLMAANVQASLLPRIAPSDTDWDCAFFFRPMAKVSGDFYDFYVSDGRLCGLSLFDVSGHGISSGLITMIARSLAHRHFIRGNDIPLGKLFRNLNQDLVTEIGNVDNYLTGIMLRMQGDTIEYVNAGHTELLLRKRGTKKPAKVNLKEGDIKGWFLGIEGMCGDYRSLRFRVTRGDIVLLYSDCVIETMNENGEQFGEERLLETLRDAPHDQAGRVITHLVDTLNTFCGHKPLEDDLTIIALRKT